MFGSVVAVHCDVGHNKSPSFNSDVGHSKDEQVLVTFTAPRITGNNSKRKGSHKLRRKVGGPHFHSYSKNGTGCNRFVFSFESSGV